MVVVPERPIDSLLAAARATWRTDPAGALRLALVALGRADSNDHGRRMQARQRAAEACLQLQMADRAVQILTDGWSEGADVVSYRLLGAAYSRLGHLDAALEAFEAGKDVGGADEDAYHLELTRAAALRRHGRRSEALLAFRALWALPAPNITLRLSMLLNLASCLSLVGQTREARDRLDEAEALEAEEGSSLFRRWRLALSGWVALGADELERARRDAEAALAVNGPADRAATCSATRALAQVEARNPACLARALGRLERLAAELDREALDPDRETVIEELAELHRGAGNLERAYELLSEAARVRKRLAAMGYERMRVAEMARMQRYRQEIESDELRLRNRQLADTAARLAMECEAHLRRTRQVVHDLRNPLTVIVASLDLLDPSVRPDLQSSMQVHARTNDGPDFGRAHEQRGVPHASAAVGGRGGTGSHDCGCVSASCLDQRDRAGVPRSADRSADGSVVGRPHCRQPGVQRAQVLVSGRLGRGWARTHCRQGGAVRAGSRAGFSRCPTHRGRALDGSRPGCGAVSRRAPGGTGNRVRPGRWAWSRCHCEVAGGGSRSDCSVVNQSSSLARACS